MFAVSKSLPLLAVVLGLPPCTAFAQDTLTSTGVTQEKAALPVPTYQDVKYGLHPTKNVLDFWQAKAKGPTPVLVSIHHGGFTQGKKFVRADLLKECLEAGISVAAINYRLAEQAIAPAPFHDSARAVQFLRHRAVEWNIDPKR